MPQEIHSPGREIKQSGTGDGPNDSSWPSHGPLFVQQKYAFRSELEEHVHSHDERNQW